MTTIINSKEDREKLKKEFELSREAGNLNEALEGFKSIAEWDLSKNNQQGYIDVLGHINICLKLLIEKETDSDKKKLLSSDILETATTTVEKAKEFKLSVGAIAIQQINLAQAFLANSEFYIGDAQTAQLSIALDVIDEALSNFPGTEAHKAWPLNAKAQVQYKLGNTEAAFKTLSDGQVALYKGYEQQISEDNNSDMKIRIWLTGLYLTLAKICAETNRKHLAYYYANSVISIPDPEDHLANRKSQAQKILNELK